MSIAIGHSRPRRRNAAWHEFMMRRRRRMLATGFQRVLDDARRPARGLTARVAVNRGQALDAAADMERLVARLRDDNRAIGDESLAQARELLCDGSGPLFTWAEPGTLRRRVRVLCEAME